MVNEISVNTITLYTINGLTSEDVEMICLGLDSIHEPEMAVRKSELTRAIEACM